MIFNPEVLRLNLFVIKLNPEVLRLNFFVIKLEICKHDNISYRIIIVNTYGQSGSTDHVFLLEPSLHVASRPPLCQLSSCHTGYFSVTWAGFSTSSRTLNLKCSKVHVLNWFFSNSSSDLTYSYGFKMSPKAVDSKYISSPEVPLEVQALIPNWLLNISTWMSNRQLKHIKTKLQILCSE